jgi:peptidoglycan/LPS O-acetylase OafA/YrhL
VELVCSFVLPLLFFISLQGQRLWKMILLFGLIAWSFVGNGNLATFMFMFDLGLLVPEFGQIVFKNLKPALAIWLGILAWVGLLFSGYNDLYLLQGITAFLVISGLLYGPETKWHRVLDMKPVRFYGRISYSFYLYHMICLYFASKLFFQVISINWMLRFAFLTSGVFLLVSVMIATVAAWLSYHCVEVPGIELSKVICRWLTFRVPAAKRVTEPVA